MDVSDKKLELYQENATEEAKKPRVLAKDHL